MIANLIAGHWCQPHTPALPVYNPATEDVLDEVPLSGPAEVNQAVAAAAEAYVGWSQTSVIIIEDLHWLDEASQDFLETWIAAVEGTRVLMVLTFRPAGLFGMSTTSFSTQFHVTVPWGGEF
jgi:predicted ATPase